MTERSLKALLGCILFPVVFFCSFGVFTSASASRMRQFCFFTSLSLRVLLRPVFWDCTVCHWIFFFCYRPRFGFLPAGGCWLETPKCIIVSTDCPLNIVLDYEATTTTAVLHLHIKSPPLRGRVSLVFVVLLLSHCYLFIF